MPKKKKQKQIKKELLFEIYGISILTISVIAIASVGALGRNLTYLSRFVVGTWDFTIPLLGIGLGFYVMVKRRWPQNWTPRMTGVLLVVLALLGYLHLLTFHGLKVNSNFGIVDTTWNLLLNERYSPHPTDVGGGMVGAFVYAICHYLFDDIGTIFTLGAVILTGILLITGFSYVHFAKRFRKNWSKQQKDWRRQLIAFVRAYYDRRDRERRRRKSLPAPQLQMAGEAEISKEVSQPPIIHDFEDQVIVPEKTGAQLRLRIQEHQKKPEQEPASEKEKIVEQEIKVDFSTKKKKAVDYRLPGLQLLKWQKKSSARDKESINANAKKLAQTLESFGVRVRVTEVSRGPAVTRYEIQPEVGVKVSKIVNLTDDLALALAAKDIRMEAPIPGKSAIGIEVPNSEVSIVALRDVLEDDTYQNAESKLSIGLGRDISGLPIVADLAKMPHLLVAGATGAGKSVCINGIIISLLFNAKPDEVKLMMIDPKMVELNIYNGIPHLLAPVVTEPRKAAIALKRVVAEMEKRYELFAKHGARDMERYNKLAEEDETIERLPQIVVIVDELADLMMVAPADVEDAICRLAQMARAAGIHLIIATQRPSVDVITGLIKANIPSRIAFAVSSSADSRTILDMGGAEKLLGRGDMLYLPIGASKPLRVQGTFVTDTEVEAVVRFAKTQQEPEYDEEMIPKANEETSTVQEIQDELYPQAVQLVVEAQTASVSLIQRRLRVGYTRAARLIDLMEANQIVGPYEGSKPREVLITQEQYVEQQKQEVN
ncbi:DNA translocase FtsK [Seinonella peptonophila]|uniref:DNA translocase FtsK n=1 Tax=Seinonella peptonophila TaxID=112248 RepID=A0A1M4TBQ3_9BACL|nr:DNA translocase FtsK [Seinonella peptonophila]SHE41893.1 DNA translocase FtsK [Seinonella peptonophila]